MMQVDIVIPAYNEEGNLERTVSRTVTTLRDADTDWSFTVLLVVGDQSTDDTPAIADRLADEFREVSVLHRSENPGFGNAIKDGLEATTGDVVVPFMADLSDDPADIPALVTAIEEGYDIAYGSRFVEGGEIDGYPPVKLLYNRAFNNAIRLLFGVRSKDVTNAFTAYRREVIEEVGVDTLSAEAFDITAELPLRAHIQGFVSTDVPVSWRGREAGVSKLNATRAGPAYGERLLDLFVRGNVLALRDLFRALASQSTARVLGATVFGLLLLFGLFSVSGFTEVFDLVLGASPLWIGVAAASFLVSFLFRTWRWRVLLRTAGHLASRGGAFRSILFGWFFNFLLPARIGDLARGMSLKTTEDVPFSVATGTIVIERILDMFVLGTGMVVIVAAVLGRSRMLWLAGGAFAISGVLLVTLVVLYALPNGVIDRLESWIPKLDVRTGVAVLRDALQRSAENPFAMSLALLLSLPVWTFEVGTLFFSARAIGLEIGPAATTVGAITGFVTQAVPLSPAGIGTYETSIAVVLGLFGIATDSATALALVDHFMRIAVIYVLGAIATVHIGFRSRAYFRSRERTGRDTSEERTEDESDVTQQTN